MTPPLGDAVVRARGLATHLLDRAALERLARSAGSGVLAAALQAAGYPPAPMQRGAVASAAEAMDAAIDHETGRRLRLLGRWLGDRRFPFAALFEDEERRAIRICVRALAAGQSGASPPRVAPGFAALDPGGAAALAEARDLPGLANTLRRNGSAYAEPLARALRAHGADAVALEQALDHGFAERARRAAARWGGRLLAWVETGIDLENAWSALLGGGAGFVEGGRRLAREEHAAVSREASARARRRRLARAFARDALAAVFADPALPLGVLEARAAAARIGEERRAARVDPLGVAPILEFALRLAAERANLRCINWGVAQGLAPQAIVDQLVVAA